MDFILNPAFFLPVLFFFVALAYSSVGLAGGSSYTALMVIFSMSMFTIPMVSLTLNLFVSTIGSYNFIRNKHVKFKLLLPFVITSVPMAYLGGSLKLPKEIFYWILFLSLLFTAFRIYRWRSTRLNLNLNKNRKIIIALVAGSVFGFIAGTVGIGGGIYLVPLIIILGLGSHKQAAACGIIFIWLNSLSGLISRLQYNSIDLFSYTPLIIAVILGGSIGSYLGATRFSAKSMERILGLIILIAVFLLTKKMLGFYF